MSFLYIDLETRSELDVTKVGSYVYAAHPSTEILCMAWARDEGPVYCNKHINLPNKSFTLVAHNADFERNVLRCKGVPVDDYEWLDTAALSARMGLPRKLEDLAAFMFPDRPEYHKDMDGNRVMKKLSKPRRPSADNPDRWWTPETKPEDFEKLYRYCAQDVEVMRACHKKLLPLEEKEHKIWALTQKMNERGVKLDVASLEPAQKLVDAEVERLSVEFRGITGCSARSPKAADALGLPDAQKFTVRDALKRDDLSPSLRRALELKRILARSSTSKLAAMQRRVSADGRLRGALVYCGAERTGRWSSHGVQLQNITRGLGKATDAAFEALVAEVLFEIFEGRLGSNERPMAGLDVVAEMLRGFIVGPFRVGDYSQIEARTLAWLAGQDDLVAAFANKADPYCMMASRIYGRTVTKDDKAERFMGKQVVLGCFTEETLVLTNRGWCPVANVKASDMLWDGETWVSHRGVVCQGEKDVMHSLGIGATPDHLFWTGEKWLEFAALVEPENSPLLSSALASGSSAWKATFSVDGVASRPSRCLVPATDLVFTESTPIICGKVARLAVTPVPNRQAPTPERNTGDTPTSSPMMTIEPGCSTELQPALAGATTLGTKIFGTTVGAESESTVPGGLTAAPSSNIYSPCPAGTTPISKSTGSTWIEDMSRGTSASPRGVRTCETGEALATLSEKSAGSRTKCVVYDIASAGPRNRFTVLTEVGPVIVHNCGYGMGPDRFRGMLDEIYDVQIEDAFARKVIKIYRRSNPKIVAFWDRLAKGLRYAIANKAKRVLVSRPGAPTIFMGTLEVGGIPYAYIELPSGRKLYYARPEIKKDELRYFGRDLGRGGWGQIHTHGGKIAENITQAFSRDLLADALLRLDESGFEPRLTVHDEILDETETLPTEEEEKDFHDIMVQTPTWAKGLPVDSEVFSCVRYRK